MRECVPAALGLDVDNTFVDSAPAMAQAVNLLLESQGIIASITIEEVLKTPVFTILKNLGVPPTMKQKYWSFLSRRFTDEQILFRGMNHLIKMMYVFSVQPVTAQVQS